MRSNASVEGTAHKLRFGYASTFHASASPHAKRLDTIHSNRTPSRNFSRPHAFLLRFPL